MLDSGKHCENWGVANRGIPVSTCVSHQHPLCCMVSCCVVLFGGRERSINRWGTEMLTYPEDFALIGGNLRLQSEEQLLF